MPRKDRPCCWCGQPCPNTARRLFCTDLCRVKSFQAQQREAQGLPVQYVGASMVADPRECQQCGEPITAPPGRQLRSNAKWCSPACRTAGYRQAK